VDEVFAFSPEQVCRLTGLSDRQLRYWDETGFFSPAFREEVRRSPYARVYSFQDVVGLRALAVMRKRHGVPLQTLRRVGEFLRDRYDEPWSMLTFYIVGKEVFYQEQEAIRRADETGQLVQPFELVRVESDLRAGMRQLRERSPKQVGHITRNRYVADNQHVLDGTRIPTGAIWEFHAAGYDERAIQGEYGHLSVEDIRAAIEFEQRQRTKAS
jgi:DNA-binding transcriptional MerR regulator